MQTINGRSLHQRNEERFYALLYQVKFDPLVKLGIVKLGQQPFEDSMNEVYDHLAMLREMNN